MGLAQKLIPKNGITTLHRAFDNENDPSYVVGHPKEIIYLGVTELSVQIDFVDGSQLRITNPHFTSGLELRSYEKDD